MFSPQVIRKQDLFKMNLKKLVLAVAMSSSMVVGAHAADQGHGTINFIGSIIDAPCSISPDTIDQTVDLGQVSSKALANNGMSTPRSFDIKLEQCDAASATNGVTVTFTGQEAAAGTDLLAIAGSAKGAAIGLTSDAGTPIKLGTATTAQKVIDGDNVLHFAAYLQGTGASSVTPGDFTSVANFALNYQ